MAVCKNQTVLCSITGISSEGFGVSRVDGFAVFIPMALPGEAVEALIIKVYKTYAIGKLIKVIEKAENRISLDCDIAEKCGGCALRHISYDGELQLKRQRVEQAMGKIACLHVNIPEVIPSERILHYRNKAQIPIGSDGAGGFVRGFYTKNSHRIVANSGCYLGNPVFDGLSDLICDFASREGIYAYNEVTKKGLLRHLYFRIGESTGDIMVCIVINGDSLPRQEKLVSLITENHPDVKSILININKKSTNVILGEKYSLLYGDWHITDVLCGNKFFISPQSFYQVNKPQAEKLYKIALDMLSPTKDDVLLDLYCGIGTITLTAAGRCKSITGVEIVEKAIENAKMAAKANNIGNAHFVCADAGAPLKVLTEGKFDAVILDPPRKGISPSLAHDLCESDIPKILYISCGPETLARDIKLLAEGGYELKDIKEVDLFPRTAHVECVVLMSRSEKRVCEKIGKYWHSSKKGGNKMIVFRPIGLNEYQQYNKLKFKEIPNELISQGGFEIYFDDIQVHRVAKLGSMNNPEWYYVGFVIQFCLKDQYIDYLKKVNGFPLDQWLIKTPLKVPKTDGTKINNAIIRDVCVVGFYYNKGNLQSKLPMENNDIRRMQILQHYTKWDPEGLIELHAPRDEYFGEIQEIWGKVTENTSTVELAAIITSVTEEAFGVDYFKNKTDILKIANEINSFNKE